MGEFEAMEARRQLSGSAELISVDTMVSHSSRKLKIVRILREAWSVAGYNKGGAI